VQTLVYSCSHSELNPKIQSCHISTTIIIIVGSGVVVNFWGVPPFPPISLPLLSLLLPTNSPLLISPRPFLSPESGGEGGHEVLPQNIYEILGKLGCVGLWSAKPQKYLLEGGGGMLPHAPHYYKVPKWLKCLEKLHNHNHLLIINFHSYILRFL